MKRGFTTVMFTLLLVAAAAACVQAQGVIVKDPNPKPVLLAPDLKPDGVRMLDLYAGKVEVIVLNVGKKASTKSLVRLLITMPGEEGSTTYSADVPPIKAGEAVWVPINTKKHLNLAGYCVVADALDQNKESVEKNNERCGHFPGKP